MGSKSGRRRRDRESKLRRADDTSHVPASSRKEEPAAGDAPAESVGAPGPGSRDLEPGPTWAAPTPQPPAADAQEALLPLSSPPPTGSAAGPASLSGAASPRDDASAPVRAQLSDPGVTVAHGARETLDAIRRMETRVDRLTEWLGAFTAWYQHEHRREGGLFGDAVRSRHRHLLVAAMLGIFLPVIVGLVLGARFGWF